jgi:hypothetical protein
MDKELLDLKDSKLILQGNDKVQKQWSKKIDADINDLKEDKQERASIYRKRRDFFRGEQGDYSNIMGIVKDTKQKKGHTNQVTNYAGKTVVKMAFGIANNPPKLTTTPEDINDEIEVVRAQAIESYIDSILESNTNRFWKRTYRRGAFIQSELGDYAIKTYLDPVTNSIKLCGHDDMETIMVGWNGEPGNFDFVIVQNYITPALLEELYGIKVNEKALSSPTREESESSGAWLHGGQWGRGSNVKDSLPTGKSKMAKVKVVEYDSNDVYAIKVEGELVQLILKDDINYPRTKMWTIISNIPNPPSPWSIADIDYLMDLQVELNENDNRTADHLRVGNVQRYVAYNLSDFDPESIKTTSGQVIFVDDPDGKARFEPLQTNINNFPDDQYNQRKLQQMYDLGLPKVNYGASGADSGRSKAIDYQSSVDLTQFKRDAWELALQDICEKIQILGNYLLGDQYDWFKNTNGDFIVRKIEFDWNDILPISQSDKIVNVANKFNMIGIPMEQAFKELGYRNPKALMDQLKNELKDPDLMILRSKMWQLSQGLLMANNQAAAMSMSNTSEAVGGGAVNQGSPMLTSDQNTGASQPMASSQGTTAVSSAAGILEKAQQNMTAGGQ